MQLAEACHGAQRALEAVETEIRDNAQILYSEGQFQRRAFLVSHGIPLDVAMGLASEELIAWTIAFGEVAGDATFDWREMRWVPRED